MIKLKDILKEDSNQSSGEYPPYMYSPIGFSCAVCAAHSIKDGVHLCSAPEYKEYKGTNILVDDNNKPITDPTKWCSNWFYPKGK